MIPYLTPEQVELRAQARRFLATRSPLTEVRRLMATDTGYDPAVWRVMADQLGLQGLGIAEQYGGMGAAPVELCLVIEEMGYALMGSPYMSNVLAAIALQAAHARELTETVLRDIAGGHAIATLCFAEANRTRSAVGAGIAAERRGDGWGLAGCAAQVSDGAAATVLVVVANVDGEPALFRTDPADPSTTVTPLPTLDQTHKLARVEFAGSGARLLTSSGVAELADHLRDVAAVLLAAECLGGARHALDMSVAYAGQREQFGRLIGSFQAIKFACADMHLLVESCRSIVFYASHLLASPADRAELPAVASLAKAYCSDAFFDVAAQTLQIHGGIGFTWEHDAHLFFKRASASRLMWGDSDWHRERLVQLVGMAG